MLEKDSQEQPDACMNFSTSEIDHWKSTGGNLAKACIRPVFSPRSHQSSPLPDRDPRSGRLRSAARKGQFLAKNRFEINYLPRTDAPNVFTGKSST
jgi:hypothetical protein